MSFYSSFSPPDIHSSRKANSLNRDIPAIKMKKKVFQNLENRMVTGDPGHAYP